MSVPYSDNAAPAAAGIGARLREAREARGLTVGDAAHALKLTLRQVEALEADDFGRLPGTAFARGFLRNYARLLGLDPEPLIGAFEAFHTGATVELRPISNAQGALPAGGGRGPSAMPATLAAAALLGLVVAGWYFDWFRQPKSLAPTDSSTPVAVLPPLEAAAPLAPPAGAEAGSVAPEAAPAAPQAAPAVAGTLPALAPDGLERLAFDFGQEAWVEVRDASGEIIFSRISKAGSTQEVQGRGPFTVVVGNAENVKLSHNGKAVDLLPHIKSSVARLSLQ